MLPAVPVLVMPVSVVCGRDEFRKLSEESSLLLEARTWSNVPVRFFALRAQHVALTCLAGVG